MSWSVRLATGFVYNISTPTRNSGASLLPTGATGTTSNAIVLRRGDTACSGCSFYRAEAVQLSNSVSPRRRTISLRYP